MVAFEGVHRSTDDEMKDARNRDGRRGPRKVLKRGQQDGQKGKDERTSKKNVSQPILPLDFRHLFVGLNLFCGGVALGPGDLVGHRTTPTFP